MHCITKKIKLVLVNLCMQEHALCKKQLKYIKNQSHFYKLSEELLVLDQLIVNT